MSKAKLLFCKKKKKYKNVYILDLGTIFRVGQKNFLLSYKSWLLHIDLSFPLLAQMKFRIKEVQVFFFIFRRCINMAFKGGSG